MKTLIVYDSFFGNTEKVAKSISENLPDSQLVKVNEYNPEMLKDIDLLIVGSPTRAFSASPAIKAFLKNLPSLSGKKVAAFDTRMKVEEVNNKFLTFMAKNFGYAAEKIAKMLVKKGGSLLTDSAWYYVKDSEGPLKDGDLERASNWLVNALK